MLALPPVTADKQFENLTAAPQRLMILSGCSACMFLLVSSARRCSSVEAAQTANSS
jgi:hypothetical protein